MSADARRGLLGGSTHTTRADGICGHLRSSAARTSDSSTKMRRIPSDPRRRPEDACGLCVENRTRPTLEHSATRLTILAPRGTFNRMVESPAKLDLVFRALGDGTRRAMLRRLAAREL